MVCELCGSNDFTKEKGYWKCNYCDTKYSEEEAKKIVIDGPVITKSDLSTELENFSNLAEQYYSDGNMDQALVYFRRVLEIDPKNWRAVFYSGVCSSRVASFLEFKLVDSVAGMKNALNMLYEEHASEDEYKNFILEMLSVLLEVIQDFWSTSDSIYNQYWELESSTTELIQRLTVCVECFKFCLTVTTKYDLDPKKTQLPVAYNLVNCCIDVCLFRDYKLYYKGEEVVHKYKTSSDFREPYIEIYRETVELMKSIDPNVTPDQINAVGTKYQEKSEGCYVATAIYQTYDCPELWVLRRFRDNTLYHHYLGKKFIHFYYKVSPKLIIRFENSIHIKKTTKKFINRFVSLLILLGYSSEKYNGK
ncbi:MULTISPECIES: tetratricopeptide repeat protein [Lactococcus]|uniref:tetratricopeptide repeat protein n=1 Tax=Lactococcus TaxID=1357 RepID=UPI0021A68827|nr:tetratricopeptide repeat protein [Lactococcus lactis]